MRVFFGFVSLAIAIFFLVALWTVEGYDQYLIMWGDHFGFAGILFAWFVPAVCWWVIGTYMLTYEPSYQTRRG